MEMHRPHEKQPGNQHRSDFAILLAQAHRKLTTTKALAASGQGQAHGRCMISNGHQRFRRKARLPRFSPVLYPESKSGVLNGLEILDVSGDKGDLKPDGNGGNKTIWKF